MADQQAQQQQQQQPEQKKSSGFKKKDDQKYVVIDCSNGMSFIGESVYGAGARKGEESGPKIKNYIVVRTDTILEQVLGKPDISFESVAKNLYEQRHESANPGTFAPSGFFVGVHNLDEHL